MTEYNSTLFHCFTLRLQRMTKIFTEIGYKNRNTSYFLIVYIIFFIHIYIYTHKLLRWKYSKRSLVLN